MDRLLHIAMRSTQVWFTAPPHQPEVAVRLRQPLFRFRWAMTLALLTIAMLWPLPTRVGVPLWATIGLFGLYNAILHRIVARQPMPGLDAFVPPLDLLVIVSLYLLGTEPAGVTFTLFVLALLSGAIILPPSGAAVYTLLTAAIVALLAPLLPSWSAAPDELNVFAARLLILPLVGLGTALLIQQLVQVHTQAQRDHDATERTAEQERLRSEFVASVSHDLFTPLTAMNAGLGLLEDTAKQQLRADQFRLLRNARQNGERLKHLIHDLLTYNQLTAGVLAVCRAPLDLREPVIAAHAAVQALLQHKEQSLALELPDALPLCGDRHLLERMLINLLYNAHMHTPPGTRITVTGQATEFELRLTVHDTGPGIPLDAQATIFEPYARQGASGSGSGLGLAIVRRLLGLQDGRIWVESAPDRGTTFHLILPQITPGQIDGVG